MLLRLGVCDIRQVDGILGARGLRSVVWVGNPGSLRSVPLSISL